MLVVVIVLALVAAVAIGVELYARNRADDHGRRGHRMRGRRTTSTVSFGFLPPFLIQHMTGHYGNIHIETAGNQIRDAKGMKAQVTIDDVRLEDTANSEAARSASLDATIDWTADGMQADHPGFDSARRRVRHRRDDQPVRRHDRVGGGARQHHHTKPKVKNGGLTLQVEELTGLGFTLPREAVQPALDALHLQAHR